MLLIFYIIEFDMVIDSPIEISIVIPAYRSEKNLAELTKRIESALSEIPFEVIFVNDCSPDNSWQVIEGLCEKYSFVLGLSLMKNSGQDNAIIAGLNYVSGKYIVIMDDDLQHAPEDILKLYNECKKGFHVCFANFQVKKQALWKNFGSWLNGKLAEVLINKPKGIYLSPFEMITSEVVREIIKYKGAHPYIQGLIFSVTNNVTQVSVEHHDRFSGSSNYDLLKSINVFFRLATGFSVKPLRIASFVGFISAVFGFLLIPYYIYQYYFENYNVEGWTTLVVLFLLIGGLILMSLGLIGEYIGRMYLNVSSRPQFVVEKKIMGKKVL